MMEHSTFVTLSYGISALVFLILIVALIIDSQKQKKKLTRLEALNEHKRQQTHKQQTENAK